MCVWMGSDIQALQRNVSSDPTATVKSAQCKEDPQRDKTPLDNGEYLDIRGVTDADGTLNTTKTLTSTTTTTDCTDGTTTATPPHNKLKFNTQVKGSVQFDQPNR